MGGLEDESWMMSIWTRAKMNKTVSVYTAPLKIYSQPHIEPQIYAKVLNANTQKHSM